MCLTASGFFRPDTMEVKVYDLASHEATAEKLGLGDGPEPNGWREFHYTPTGVIECRVLAVDKRTASEAAAFIKERWPTFKDFFNWALAAGEAPAPAPSAGEEKGK